MPAFRHSERVAIIGGGCTGTTCFWALQNTAHDVHLFEASSTLGGRIKELSFEHNGNWTSVNTEPPSFNAEASPNLVSLLRHLGIPTSAIPFTFSTSVGIRTFEWCGNIVKAALRQPRVLCHLETYRTLVDIVWFKYLVGETLDHRFGTVHKTKKDISTGDYLTREKYSNSFTEEYLAPLLSVLWRTNALKYLPKLPIQALVQCLSDHQFFHSPQILPDWCRIDKGASQLIQIMAKASTAANIHLRTKVQEVRRFDKDTYRVLMTDGREMDFDRIVFAIDGQDILDLLDSNVEPEEQVILQRLRAGTNIVVLHSDQNRIPDVDHSYPSSNYISFANSTNKQEDRDLASKLVHCKSSLTYNVNTLQGIPVCIFGRIFITVNPLTPPRPPLVQGVWEFTDADPNLVTLHAQTLLPSIQNKRGLSYAFRWTGRGFLEDSVSAGLEIAIEHFGAHVPFEVIYHGDPMCPEETLRLNLRQQVIKVMISFSYAYVLLFQICWVLLGGFWARLHVFSAPSSTRRTLNRVQQFQKS